MANYINVKMSIAKNQTKKDFCLLNYDDEILRKQQLIPKTLFVSIKEKTNGAYFQDGFLYLFDKPLIAFSKLKLFGSHNISNALFAILAAKLYGASEDIICERLQSFEGLPHRLEVVGISKNGEKYINDSKATNIDSSLTAINAMDAKTILLLGGSDKGYEFDSLFSGLRSNIYKVVVFGATKEKLMQAADRVGVEVISALNLKEALLKANALAKTSLEKSNILLSPACASFDEFENYEHRGMEFAAMCRNLLDT